MEAARSFLAAKAEGRAIGCGTPEPVGDRQAAQERRRFLTRARELGWVSVNRTRCFIFGNILYCLQETPPIL